QGDPHRLPTGSQQRAGQHHGVARVLAPGRLLPPPRVPLPRRGAILPIAEGVAGVLALAALLTGCLGFALASAERPSFLAPPTLHGDPSWVAGPLAGHWPALSHAVGSLRWGATVAL